MGKASQWILITLGVLISGLLVVLIVMMATSDDSDPVAGAGESTSTTVQAEETTVPSTQAPDTTDEVTPSSEDTTAPDDTTDSSGTTPTSEDTTAPDDTTDSSGTTPTSEDTTAPDDTTDSSGTTPTSEDTTAPPPEPVEVFRGVADLLSGDLWGTDTTPLFFMSVSSQGFATSHRWALQQAGSPPGPEVCRDSTAAFVDETVPFAALAFSVGWYGCFDVDGELVGQLHIIDVQPQNERVIAEVVLWDFTP